MFFEFRSSSKTCYDTKRILISKGQINTEKNSFNIKNNLKGKIDIDYEKNLDIDYDLSL